MVSWKRILIGPVIVAWLLVGVSGAQTAFGSSPPKTSPGKPPSEVAATASPDAARGDAVKAVVVRSWSACGSGGVIWDDLNANWSQFGSVPITIDYSETPLCSGPVTYDALVASGADVVIISDPSGGNQQLSAAEGKAIHRYAMQGHNVIGTYALLAFGTIDNHLLTPTFGLRVGTTYLDGEQAVDPTYRIRTPDIALFRDVPDPYASSGYGSSQVPTDDAWGGNDLKNAVMVGRTQDARAAIFLYNATHYSAIYITNMPEYGGGTADQQLFYNSIIYPQTGS